jgi:MFS superfamily sulfate permease-like transporter
MYRRPKDVDLHAAIRKTNGMQRERSRTGFWHATTAGLIVGALGIAILWGSGQEFPFYPPPGIIILVTGALFVALARRRWTPAVGAGLGLFVTIGFLLSGLLGEGFDSLLGHNGTVRAIGQAIQQLGVIAAAISGVSATRINYRRAGLDK